MIKEVLFAMFATVITCFAAVSIIANCGSTWSTLPPTFGPVLNLNNCTTSTSPNKVTTTKSVKTTIFWSPLEVWVTDEGENKWEGITQMIGSCNRCFPEFYAPEWVEIGNDTTDWRQKTDKKVIFEPKWGMCIVGQRNDC